MIKRDSEGVLSNKNLSEVLDQLDSCTQELIETRERIRDSYSNKAEIVKEIRKLETEKRLIESNAIMDIKGSGRKQYVIIDGEEVGMGNQEKRKAYMRQKTEKQRKEIAELEAELKEIEIKMFQAKDDFKALKEIVETLRNKAGLQSSLLDYMSIANEKNYRVEFNGLKSSLEELRLDFNEWRDRHEGVV